MWKDLHDAQMRANYTVVRFNGKPVYISSIKVDVDGELIAHFLYLSNSNKNAARLSDEGWDWSPVPTGFVNTGSRVFYVQRIPCRKYKHGLSKDNCSVTPEGLGIGEIFRSRQFGNTVCREYPSYAEALEAVKQNIEVAFHPDFALKKKDVGPVFLLYRTDTVGWFERGEVVLGDEYRYLKELVQEVTA